EPRGAAAGRGARGYNGPMISRTFVIAEAGVNHNGALGLARALRDVAAAAGADAVKFQTFTADGLVTRTAPTAEYQQRALGAAATPRASVSARELPPAAHEALWAHCASRGIEFMSTPFDVESAHY